jgi:alkylation response protein AidB-like acyl-CoA dehydrogenase
MVEPIERLRQLHRAGALELPLPGSGSTRQRHRALLELGREDLSLARLAEAHCDAVAILAEAGRVPRPGALYGVWAAEGPGSTIEVGVTPGGQWTLRGTKRYCSGAPLLDAALVTARHNGASALFDVSLKTEHLSIDASGWAAPAFSLTQTASVTFESATLDQDCLIGAEGWYLSRPGFWHGALGPASCWAGGALGLVDAARALGRSDPHSMAHIGALEANSWALQAVLNQAGDEIDADPSDEGNQAKARALKARHIIERLCTDTLDRFGRATGPQLLAFDEHVARRYAELTLYIRQCHAERDLHALASSGEGPRSKS